MTSKVTSTRRYIIMHRTAPKWERGEIPSPELIERVGALLGEMAKAGVLLGGEGLRASSLGVRLRFQGGERTAIPGPFVGDNELPAGLVIVRVASLDEAVRWADRFAAAIGDVEIDVRPVTEPWDIGIGVRPASVKTTRYMLLHKATPATESGAAPTRAEREAVRAVLAQMDEAGILVTREALAPSSRGRRYKNSDGQRTIVDGPFAESKELIAGYILFTAPDLDAASAYLPRYADVVECTELDLREVLDGG